MTIDNDVMLELAQKYSHKLGVDGDINLSGNYKVNGNIKISWIDVDQQNIPNGHFLCDMSQQNLTTISGSARYVLADVFITGPMIILMPHFQEPHLLFLTNNKLDNQRTIFNTI